MLAPLIFARCLLLILLACCSCWARRASLDLDLDRIHGLELAALQDNSNESSPKKFASEVADLSFMLVNLMSGGVEGQRLLEFMQHDHPEIPAVPLGSDNGTATNQMLSRLRKASRIGHHARVICAGGDGTASWCFSVLSSLQKQLGSSSINAAVVMCPLGTGNDLAQSLGWGAGYPSDVDDWLQGAFNREAHFAPFDAWALTFEPADQDSSCHAVNPHFNTRLEAGNTWPMILYVSTGWDADVIRHFQRSKIPGLGQALNKLQHAIRSVMTVSMNTTSHLGVTYQLCNGKGRKCRQQLDPGLDQGGSVAVLNTPSMTGGANLWGTPAHESGFTPAQVDDEKLEVIASSSAIATGLSRWTPYQLTRLGQAKGVRLNWEAQEGGRAFQVDGEGLYCFGAGLLRIARQGAVAMVIGPNRATQFQNSALWPMDSLPPTSFSMFA